MSYDYMSHPCVPAMVAAAVYLNSMMGLMVLDDEPAITRNLDLRPGMSWGALLSHDFWGTPIAYSTSNKSYRPLTVATFRLNYGLHGLRPEGYHLVNIALHALVTYLFHRLCDRLLLLGHASATRSGGGSGRSSGGTAVAASAVAKTTARWEATVAALLFALHPVHTEAVAGVVGRAELLAACFVLLAALAFLPSGMDGQRFPLSGWWSWARTSLCVLFSMGGVLSKEQAIMGLPVCAALDLSLLATWPSSPSIPCSSPSSTSLSSSPSSSTSPSPRTNKKGSTRKQRRRERKERRQWLRQVWFWGLLRTVALALAFAAIVAARFWVMGSFVGMTFRGVLGDVFGGALGGASGGDSSWSGGALRTASRLPMDEVSNPAAHAPLFATRALTFLYLLPVNAAKLLLPALGALCCDWSRGSIPLVESTADPRNAATLLFAAAAAAAAVDVVAHLLALATVNDVDGDGDDGDDDDDDDGGSGDRSGKKDQGQWVRWLVRWLVREGAGAARLRRLQLAVPRLAALVLVVLPFLPASNLLLPVGFVVAERVLYTPSMGFCLAAVTFLFDGRAAQGPPALADDPGSSGGGSGGGSGVHAKMQSPPSSSSSASSNEGRVAPSPPPPPPPPPPLTGLRLWRDILRLVALASVLFFYCVTTVARNRHWRTPEALWRSGTRANPRNSMLWYNLGHELEDYGKSSGAAAAQGRDEVLQAAWGCFSKAQELDPRGSDAATMLGIMALRWGRTDIAQEKFEQALAGRAPPATAHYNYALLVLIKDRPDLPGRGTTNSTKGGATIEVEVSNDGGVEATRARNATMTSSNTNTTHSNTTANEAEDARAKRHLETAVTHLRQALKLNPAFTEAHATLGDALAQLGRTDEAIEVLAAAFRRNPATDVGNSAAPILAKLQELTKAKKQKEEEEKKEKEKGEEKKMRKETESGETAQQKEEGDKPTENLKRCQDLAMEWEVEKADRCFAVHVRMYPRHVPGLTSYGLFIATQSLPEIPAATAAMVAKQEAMVEPGNESDSNSANHSLTSSSSPKPQQQQQQQQQQQPLPRHAVVGRRRYDEALALLERARKLEPSNPEPAILACNVRREGGGDGPLALAEAERCLVDAAAAYRHPVAFRNLAALRSKMGRAAEAADAAAMAEAIERELSSPKKEKRKKAAITSKSKKKQRK